MSKILHVSWHMVLILSSIAVLLGVISLFSKECRDLLSSEILKGIPDMSGNE